MNSEFSEKINFLKALAILIVVAGHLEFSLIPMFPPYSFQVILFFFIAGILYKEKYSFFEYTLRRAKSLLLPYFLYCGAYIIITKLLTPVFHKFWGMPVTIKNELLMPFLTGHQLDLISPLWFVPCLFITLIIYKIFSYIKIPNYLKLAIYFVLALLAIYFQKYSDNINILWLLRSSFALFFVHLGYLYKLNLSENKKIYSHRVLIFVLILQAFLWLTNKDYTAADGIGLHFLLVWGKYNNWIVPVLTSLTGIYISLFIVEMCYEKVKNWEFLKQIGQNTYHIMANHLLVFNVFTYTFLAAGGLDFEIKNSADIYWFFCPLKTTYFYFTVGIIITVYIGMGLKALKKSLVSKH